MVGPTPRQLDVLRALQEHGTVRAVARALGLTATRGVDQHIGFLVAKGLVDAALPPGYARRYRLTDTGLAAIGLKRCDCCKGTGTQPVPLKGTLLLPNMTPRRR